MNEEAASSAAYPLSFADIARWAQANTVTVAESRVRFAQFAILASIARDHDLSQRLVLKGGNALDFIWQPNRSTRDLDFSYDDEGGDIDLDPARLHGLLKRQFDVTDREYGALLAVHRVVQQPPGADRTFITFEARVGFALPDELRLRQRMQQGEPSANVIPLDVSMNETICASEFALLAAGISLRVSTIDDILAEKLRALLQQTVRDRRQDLLDIVVALESNPAIDPARVAAYLLEKARARDVTVSRRAFHNPDVIQRASRGYAELEVTTRRRYIPLTTAIERLHGFINTLDIPDT